MSNSTDSAGSHNETQIVYRAANVMEAHIVAGMLRSCGLRAEVGGHYLQGAVGELPAADFAVVRVQTRDLELARQLIEDYEVS